MRLRKVLKNHKISISSDDPAFGEALNRFSRDKNPTADGRWNEGRVLYEMEPTNDPEPPSVKKVVFSTGGEIKPYKTNQLVPKINFKRAIVASIIAFFICILVALIAS